MEIFDKYVGQIFDRRYKIKKIIGVGGMAIVFEAYDMLKNRPVAVKMLKDDISGDTQAVKRFINESKAVAMLSHPNIVNIYDVSVKENLKYIVMELIEGITLKNYMQKKGALSFKEVVSITEQILRALEHAHSKGIVHRDIKPQNIMLLKDGSIKVADFGIAKLPNAETVTMTDKAIGTVFYISPEQASGKPIDHRSDLYSLGATVYEMATGKLPFTADSPVSVALMQVKSIPKNPREHNPSIPRGLEQIILISMEKNPSHRFQSATQMLRHLLQIKNNPKAVFKVTAHNTENENLVSHTNNSKKSSRVRRGGSMFPIIMGIASSFVIVAIVSAISILTALASAASSDTGRSVTVPDFGNYVYDDVEFRKTWGEDYKFTVKEIYDESDAGTVIEQFPEEGNIRKIKSGQTLEIKLTVSLGAEQKTLDDYRYLDYRTARITLANKLGFNVKIEEEYHDYIPEGHIISTDPAEGSVVAHGSTITLKVSKGQNDDEHKTKVPDFIGLTEKEAKEKLEESNLRLGSFKYVSSDEPKGTVVFQNVAAEQEVLEGTRINFEVSRGSTQIILDDYENTDYRNAELAIKNLKLSAEIIFEFSDEHAKNKVIATVPVAGSSVNNGDLVIIKVSKGKAPEVTTPADGNNDEENKRVFVPDFLGKTEEQAVELIEQKGLAVGEIEYRSSSEEKGIVINQNIFAGHEVKAGTKINLTVSKGR
jgi:serine/threonine-protein kinase